MAAWFVYPAEVNVELVQQPLDVLKAFVENYGVPITIGPTSALFIESEKIPPGTPVQAKFGGDIRNRFTAV